MDDEYFRQAPGLAGSTTSLARRCPWFLETFVTQDPRVEALVASTLANIDGSWGRFANSIEEVGIFTAVNVLHLLDALHGRGVRRTVLPGWLAGESATPAQLDWARLLAEGLELSPRRSVMPPAATMAPPRLRRPRKGVDAFEIAAVQAGLRHRDTRAVAPLVVSLGGGGGLLALTSGANGVLESQLCLTEPTGRTHVDPFSVSHLRGRTIAALMSRLRAIELLPLDKRSRRTLRDATIELLAGAVGNEAEAIFGEPYRVLFAELDHVLRLMASDAQRLLRTGTHVLVGRGDEPDVVLYGNPLLGEDDDVWGPSSLVENEPAGPRLAEDPDVAAELMGMPLSSKPRRGVIVGPASWRRSRRVRQLLGVHSETFVVVRVEGCDCVVPRSWVTARGVPRFTAR